MFVYWALFSFFASGALVAAGGAQSTWRRRQPLLLVGALLCLVAIGLRNEVGADWEAYEYLFAYAGYADLGRLIEIGDPGYQFLSWVAHAVDAEIWLVNTVCGAIFTWGLYRLARAQPDPWLAFVVAVPYLIVVVAMGYTRQAVALGILMAGLAAVQNGASVLRFAIYVAWAALFHRTAVIVLPLVIFATERNRVVNAIAGAAIFVLLYDLFLAESVDDFVSNYIKTEYSSQGAAIRVVMSLVPATIFLLAARRFGFSPREERMWRYFSIAAWAFLGLLIVLPSSTAVDRIALYVAPLQVVILSRLPYVFTSGLLGKLAVIGYSFMVLYVWLNYAVHAEYWIPYQVYPL